MQSISEHTRTYPEGLKNCAELKYPDSPLSIGTNSPTPGPIRGEHGKKSREEQLHLLHQVINKGEKIITGAGLLAVGGIVYFSSSNSQYALSGMTVALLCITFIVAKVLTQEVKLRAVYDKISTLTAVNQYEKMKSELRGWESPNEFGDLDASMCELLYRLTQSHRLVSQYVQGVVAHRALRVFDWGTAYLLAKAEDLEKHKQKREEFCKALHTETTIGQLD